MKNMIILLFFNLFLIIGCNNKIEKKGLEKEVLTSSKIEISQEKVVDMVESKEEQNVKIIDTIKPKKIVRTIEKYKENINSFAKKKNNKDLITVKEIESVTPTTQEEFNFYYSLTDSNKNRQSLYDGITASILDNAAEDNGIVLFLYADIAQFVDGEYADSYHSYIETIIDNNKIKFCAVYKHLSKNSKWILEPLYNEVCKGIKRQEED